MSANEEEWVTIPGYEGYYEFSSKGRCRALRRTIKHPNGVTRIMPQKMLKRGRAGRYKTPLYRLCKGGVSRCVYVTTLWRLTFGAPLEEVSPWK
ncbi:protein of unknown function [Magnetospirillum sp. XM-1]|uniref:NUMOD4 domain-containing protein n=1 Tax=Magnetospirillum sp. XM-1 TaxID=1663591 RepID=UPI00073DEDA9|nr:NUMOD4 domain-containing protein [Magnetospirillum sp. XM-1]CUW38819.1 protein of unknown function [Magnetospirillum sp. XM-1]